MHVLALVHHVNIPVRMEILLALDNGSQIRGGVEGRAVGLAHQTGRNLLGVRLLGHVHHQGSLALVGQPLFREQIDQPGNVGLRVALPFPEVKGHVQIAVILLQVRNGNPDNVVPDSPKRRITVLKL